MLFIHYVLDRGATPERQDPQIAGVSRVIAANAYVIETDSRLTTQPWQEILRHFENDLLIRSIDKRRIGQHQP